MKLGIMQPYFFPYIGYWQLMNAVDKYVIYDDVNFIKGGWINRNRILMNNKDYIINLKMNGASSNKLINEIQVADDVVYKKKFLRTIENCYKKAPYFSEVYPIVESIMMQNECNIAKFLEYSIMKIVDYLSIKTEIILSSDIEKNNTLKGQDKVLEICRILQADEYYNAIGGCELYSFKKFMEHNVKLSFLKTEKIIYTQFTNKFVSNLSIIDVMMFNSINEVKDILIKYKLI